MSAPYLNPEGYPDPTAKKALDRAARTERSARPNHMSAEQWAALKEQKSPLKYRNNKVSLPDGEFDSEKESVRYAELKLLERAGRISDLKCQVWFEIIPEQRRDDGKLLEHAAHYIADFTYTENGEMVVEDVKSPITRKNPAYVLKRKLMLFKHGMRIKET